MVSLVARLSVVFSRSGHAISKRARRIPREALVCPACILAVLGVFCIVMPLDIIIPSSLQFTLQFSELTTSSSPPTNVNIWYHRHCNAINLTTVAAKDSPNRFPYAVLRDAVVDRRPSIARFFNGTSATTTASAARVLLIVTVHNSARLSREGSTVSVGDPAVVARVEYVLHSTSFLLKSRNYQPGMRTIHGRQVTEWHVGILLLPVHGASRYAVRTAVAADALLTMNLTVRRYDSKLVPFHPQLSLACILGWPSVGGPVERAASCSHADPSSASGSVLLSGGALYGTKVQKSTYYREIAHFAVRALLGPIRYDTVVMTVVSPTSVTDAERACGHWKGCRGRIRARNHFALHNIAAHVERELEAIGADIRLANRLTLIPTCTLGSDSQSSEWHDACAQSKHNGQYWAPTLAYAAVAPYFKWAVSHDMDEFLAPVPPVQGAARVRRAEEILDEAHSVVPGKGPGMVMQWLNFRMHSNDDARDLTRTLARGKMPVLRDRYNESRSNRCYYKLADDTGKSAVRCDAGLGFSIHHPVMIAHGEHNTVAFSQGFRVFRGLRTWHARFEKSKGTCEYSPQSEPRLEPKEQVIRR